MSLPWDLYSSSIETVHVFTIGYVVFALRTPHNRHTCMKGLYCPSLEQKTEHCFTPISFDWFIRRITEVLTIDIYLNLTVAMLTKMANKKGLKQRNCHF